MYSRWRVRRGIALRPTMSEALEFAACYLAALALAFAFTLLVGSQGWAFWKEEYANLPQSTRNWFKNAELTPAARRRLNNWTKCCDHADWFRTKFKPGERTDEWFYEYEPGKWKKIPQDVIHYERDPSMPDDIRREGVLFIYNGYETCFWPPTEEL